MERFEEKQWLPVALPCSGREVRWMYLDPSVFVEPFFVDTLRTQRAQFPRVAERDTDVAVMLEAAMRFQMPVPAGVIFHVSRCGSTLLTNVLRCDAEVFGLSEAPPVEYFLTFPSRPSLRPDEIIQARRMLVGSFITLYSHSKRSTMYKIVIKCVHTTLLHLRAVRAIWPNVPFVVLIRDPLEVMMSNLHTPARWIRSKHDRIQKGSERGISCAEAETISAEEYCARTIANLYRAAASQVDENCVVADYEDLNCGLYQRIARAFQIQLPDAGSTTFRQVTSAYSKDRAGCREFEDDTVLKQTSAPPVIRSLADEIARPAYEELRNRYRP